MSTNKRSARTTGVSTQVFLVANGNNSVTVPLAPLSFQRTSEIQHAYEFYRFTKLSITIPPHCRFETTQTNDSSCQEGAIGYFPEETNITSTAIVPQNVLALNDSMPFAIAVVNKNASDTHFGQLLAPGSTTKTVLRVARKSLKVGASMWYRCNGTASTENDFITQGTLIYAISDAAGATTVRCQAQIRYTIEWAGGAPTTIFTVVKAAPLPSQKKIAQESDDESKEDSESAGFEKIKKSRRKPRARVTDAE